jgi:hypothetical protein
MLPAFLAVVAAMADDRGAHGLAFDAMLVAIPFAAVATLEAFGGYLENREDAVGGLQALLWTFALAFLVLSCAARSPETQTGTMPPLGWLGVFAIKASVAAAPFVRRLAVPRTAKP